jgi:hypothetical protein
VIRSVVFRVIDLGLAEVAVRGISIFDRRRALYLQGRIMSVARRNADHSDFWRAASLRYPTDAKFVRQSLHAALLAGRLKEAEAGMASLLSVYKVRATDCNFVLGLVYIYERRGDHDAIRSLVRRFLKNLRGGPGYRLAALRLSRILLTHFVGIRRSDAKEEHERSHLQLARMLQRSSVQPASRVLLQRVLDAEEALAENNDLVLLDTDVSRTQCEAFVRLVQTKIARSEPFSMVRVGDGEAACLPYEPHLAWLARGDAIERETIWWGNALSPAQRTLMTRRVFNAIWGADCIGIPTASRFLRELRLGENDSLDRGLTGRGLRSILYSVEHRESFGGAGAPSSLFTSCHLHQDIERWQLYPALLEGKREIALVSCHSDLADLVGQKFGARVAGSLVLPPDRVSAPALKAGSYDPRRLPDILDETTDRMKDLPHGCLVLVGAGYLGKWLVDVARANGGIALDVGSVFDYWLGLTTRSYLDLNPVQ